MYSQYLATETGILMVKFIIINAEKDVEMNADSGSYDADIKRRILFFLLFLQTMIYFFHHTHTIFNSMNLTIY